MRFQKGMAPDARRKSITRAAREQLAIQLEREYQRRIAGRQRLPLQWSDRSEKRNPEQVSYHERIAEMLVELPPTTLAFVLGKLSADRLLCSELLDRFGGGEAAMISNRVGISGIAVLEGDRFIATPQGRKLLSQFFSVGSRHGHA